MGVFLALTARVFAGSAEDCWKLFIKGDYTGCIKEAKQGMQDSPWDEQLPILLARSQLALGRYPEAQTTIISALRGNQTSVQLLLAAHDICEANGQTNRAAEFLQQIGGILESLNGDRRGRIRNSVLEPPNMVALGNALLLMNAEPKLILENFFDVVRRDNPDYREVWLATGELALDKHDYQLAAKTFTDALKKFPDDPDVQYGLARAYAPSDAERTGKAIEAALNANANHVPVMLLLVDHLVDAEEYDDAGKVLDNALKVNPWDPDAWAYRAVIAHLRGDTNAEASAREKALKYWSNNPRVDNLIGTKLSQNYRFAEGAAHQRQALQFDAEYLPAKMQLAEDCLRLGDESEGWRLAREVHDHDGYDARAYNLITLRKDVIAKFTTLTNRDFVVRMSTNEAAIYGDQVLELLQKAKDTLSAKYGFDPGQPTYVEIFPEQKDFGVRTFGMPHNPGFLGVCFGHVITANSPAAESGHPENWQAVLWHEFCHVITLGMTRNKMPRWLSEGISVYEERQQNPVWGQTMNPQYREMVLGEDLTPIGDLSSAFMTPKSPMHVQFAYYESSLVVEYIVQKYGLESLKQILADLGDGVTINEAIAKHTEPIDKLEKDFAAFARDRANKLAPGLDWKKPPAMMRWSELAATLNSSETNANPTEVEDVIRRLMRKRAEETNSAATNLASAPPPKVIVSTAANTVDATNTAATPARAETTTTGSKPANYWELMAQAGAALNEERWADAQKPLKRLVELYPGQTGPESAWPLLAMTHRQLNETNQEREALIKMTALEADATDAYARLMELDDGRQDWPGVAENANRFLAVNPLVPKPYRMLARAGEALGQADPAIRSYQRLLLLDPPDPADVHYRLARLFRQKGDTAAAKRQVLQALEEAPRFPDALRLLLEIEGPTGARAVNE